MDPASAGLSLLVAARWLHFGGLAAAFGPPLAQQLGVTLSTHTAPRAGARLARMLPTGIALLLAAEGLALAARLVAAAPIGRGEGQLSGQRVAVVLLLWLASGFPRSSSGAQRRFRAAAMALALLMAALDGASASPAGAPPPPGVLPAPWWLLATVQAGHALAMTAWTGSLLTLTLLWLDAPPGTRDALAARTGRVALVAVTLLALTGTTLAAAAFPTWPSLWQTAYGRALLAKLALFAAGLVLAGAARVRATPTSAGATVTVGGNLSAGPSSAINPGAGSLSAGAGPLRLWQAELLCLAAVLLLAALLLALPLPLALS